jgi:two-component system chemotaxis response regulator CheB
VTKLLIVDDSALMRRLLTEIFTTAGDFEIAVARNGAEALEQLGTFRPDVITLDIHMPEMDGLACLDRIMVLHPCPVVMVSSLTAEGAEETLEALALGAVDFIPKPKGALSRDRRHCRGSRDPGPFRRDSPRSAQSSTAGKAARASTAPPSGPI